MIPSLSTRWLAALAVTLAAENAALYCAISAAPVTKPATAPPAQARAATVIHASNLGGAYNGKPFPASGNVYNMAGAVIGQPTFTYYEAGDTTLTHPLAGPPTAAGSYTFKATFAGNSQYLPTVTSARFVITANGTSSAANLPVSQGASPKPAATSQPGGSVPAQSPIGPTVPPIAPAVPAVTPENLVATLNAATAGATIILPAGSYPIDTGTVSLHHAIRIAGTVDAKGSPLTTLVFQNANKASSALAVYADVEICNVAFASNQPLATSGKNKLGINAVHVFAGEPSIHDCTARDVDDVVLFEAGTGGIVRNVTAVGQTIRGDFIYVAGAGGGLLIDACTCDGSQNEHCIRIDTANDGPGTNSAGNITISGCTLTNCDGKESIACRMAGGGPVMVTNCDLYSWTRAGQVVAAPALPPTLSVRSITYSNCRLHNRAYIAIDQGATAAVQITADNYASYCPVSVTGPHVQVSGSVLLVDQPNQPGINHDVVATFGLSSGDLVNIGSPGIGTAPGPQISPSK